MRTGNTKSIFIKGPKMKASSGGCRSRTEAATSQLSVLRKRLTKRHRRLSERWRDGGSKGFWAESPAAKSSPKTLNTRWLMCSKNLCSTGEPKRCVQRWGVRGRELNCLNASQTFSTAVVWIVFFFWILLFQEHTLKGWQSQLYSSHRSSTQGCSLDRIQGTLGDQQKN